MDNELSSDIELDYKIAKSFIKRYYQSFDKCRHTINRLYLENAIFVWNGNGVNNKDVIQNYILEELPASEHKIMALDVQPVHSKITHNQLLYLVQVVGTAKYAGQYDQPFHQTFILTSQDNEWKISSDCYRLQDTFDALHT